MIEINTVRAYLEHLKLAIPAITIADLVIDDIQINEVVKEVKESDLVLLALIPSHQPEGPDNDTVRDKDLMCFIALKKSDRKIKKGLFLDKMAECQSVMKQLRYQMANDMEEYNGGCSFLSTLELPTMKIDPVFNLSGTDGYEMNFSLYSNL